MLNMFRNFFMKSLGSSRSNQSIRISYNETISKIKDYLPRQEFEEGPPEVAGSKILGYGKEAYNIRHELRMQAREVMPNKEEVEMLRQRDLKKYRNPDGPTYGQYLEKNSGKDPYTEALKIYESSQTTSEEYNQLSKK